MDVDKYQRHKFHWHWLDHAVECQTLVHSGQHSCLGVGCWWGVRKSHWLGRCRWDIERIETGWIEVDRGRYRWKETGKVNESFTFPHLKWCWLKEGQTQDLERWNRLPRGDWDVRSDKLQIYNKSGLEYTFYLPNMPGWEDEKERHWHNDAIKSSPTNMRSDVHVVYLHKSGCLLS